LGNRELGTWDDAKRGGGPTKNLLRTGARTVENTIERGGGTEFTKKKHGNELSRQREELSEKR